MNGSERSAAAQRVPGYYRLLPRSLNGQLIFFTTLSLVVAIFGFGAYSVHRQSRLATSMIAVQMTALAKNLADASADPIASGNISSIQQVVTQAVSSRSIVSILVVDATGKPLSEITLRDQSIIAHYGKELVKLPDSDQLSRQGGDGDSMTDGWFLPGHVEKVVWQPVSRGNPLGWVRLTYSLDSVQEMVERAWRDAMLLSGLAIGAALSLLVILLRPVMLALGTATRFAGKLDHRLGEQMPVSRVAVEIEELGTALNSVSARLQAQERGLQENAGITQLILDSVADGIITIDEYGVIKSFNQSAAAMFGYTAEEIIGRNIKTLMTDVYYGYFDAYLEYYRAKGSAAIIRSGNEMDGLRKDGSTFPGDLAVSHSAKLGKPLLIGVVRDITERRRLDKMKSEFVSTVSHELRTPLTSISGALGLVSNGALGEIPEQAKQILAVAHRNSLRLAHLIDDLLDIDKMISGGMPFDLQAQALMPLLEQTLESIRAFGDKYQVRFALLERADDVQVRVDGGRLQQAFGNLLSNAAKYSPQGGRVEVTVRKSEGKVRVSVIDHGPGIPVEFRARIFGKFTQADSSDTRQKGGTGLGLAISKEIIERMSGRVGFDSEEGHGACFYFELPVSEAGQ